MTTNTTHGSTASPHPAPPNQTEPNQTEPLQVLAGTIDRESAEGWRHWRQTRHDFVAAPRVTLAQFRAMSPSVRQRYELHRLATHANLVVQETPMSAAVARLLTARIRSNALKRSPATRAGVMVNGGGYQGKTETVCETAAAFEDQWLHLHAHLNPDAVDGTRDLHVPVAYVQTPVTATPKSTCAAILDFYGAPHRNMTLPQLVRTVKVSLHEHGTKVLILDDITRLKMHREADQDVLDLIRSLMSMSVTLVLVGVGIPQSGLRGPTRRPGGSTADGGGDAAATQTRRRFDLIDLGPFSYDTPTGITAWVAHLAGVEDQLRLLHAAPGMLTGGTMPEYLFRRTDGIVGLLERLIEDACVEAIVTGTERLTSSLLDQIAIDLDDLPVRDPSAGEVPAVPAPRSAAPRRKGRNTVFDDHGPQPPAGTQPRSPAPR